MSIETIATADAAAPGGHYSQATAWNGLLFVSGQLPVRPDGSHMADAPFEAQAAQVMANLLAIVRAGGSSPERILKVTVYVADIAHWPAFNRIYAEAMGEAKPARAVVPVPALNHGYLVEVEAVAARWTDRQGTSPTVSGLSAPRAPCWRGRPAVGPFSL